MNVIFFVGSMCSWGKVRKESEKEKSLRFMNMKSSGKIAKKHEITFIMLIYWSSSSPHHTLSIYLLFFWLKSWAFNWVVTWDVFISAHSEFISLFSFRCCAALNFSMNDERTISNDNFFFGFYAHSLLLIIITIFLFHGDQ